MRRQRGPGRWLGGTGRAARAAPGLLLAVMLAGVPAPRPATAQEGDGGWIELAPAAGGPGARWDHTLAGDEAGGRLVLFGGRDGDNVPLGDTWLFDLATESWREASGAGTAAPSPRFGHAVAVDQGTRQLYLFAGQADGATFFDDAWRLDLETLVWSPIETGDGPRPSARYGTSAVLDGAGKLLVSHGFTFDGRFDDTWALDLATATWTDVSPAPETRPLRRCLHEAVWDAAAGRMLLFGGCSSGFGPCPQGDLWVFDPAARTWTELTPAARPAARSNPALVVDPSGERVLLLDGLTAEGHVADLWALPLAGDAGWEAISVAGEPPAARASHDAVAVGDRLYLFGGIGPDGVLADLWALPFGAAA